MLKARAFAPANISCVFKIYNHKNPRWMGSSGFGFTLNEGVIVEASRAEKTEIFFNQRKVSLPTVRKVIRALVDERVKIILQSSLPLGYGFGLSGASALATSYALNKLFYLGKSYKQLAIVAHTAEVVSATGLGDVVNQYIGGMLVKFKPSSHFIVKKIKLDNTPVYCKCFSKLLTKSIITKPILRDRINASASITLNKLEELIQTRKEVYIKDIINLSKEFAITSGLLRNKKVKDTIDYIEERHGHASMIMLGNAVFSDIPFSGALTLKISEKKAQVL